MRIPTPRVIIGKLRVDKGKNIEIVEEIKFPKVKAALEEEIITIKKVNVFDKKTHRFYRYENHIYLPPDTFTNQMINSNKKLIKCDGILREAYYLGKCGDSKIYTDDNMKMFYRTITNEKDNSYFRISGSRYNKKKIY